MLRLLIVALPPVIALLAFDEQEANAIQFEEQSPLRFEVRSPPESRLLLPAAPREIKTTAPPHTPLRTHNTHAHTSPCTRRGTGARARRSTPDQLSLRPLRAQGHLRGTNPPTAGVPPGPAGSARSFRSCRCARKTVRMLQVHTRTRAPSARAPTPSSCPPRRAGLRATHNLRSPSARANAPPRLFC